MTMKYEIRFLYENGQRGKSYRHKTFDSAKKGLRRLRKVVPYRIVSYQIVNLETGVIAEQSGRM